MRQKVNMAYTPRPSRRLEAFRRICPDDPEHSSSRLFPNSILDEIDFSQIIFHETMEDIENRNRLIQRQAMLMSPDNRINLSREFSMQLNGSITSNYIPNGNVAPTMQQTYGVMDRGNALMHLQVYGQNNISSFNQGVSIIEAPEEMIWNSNHLTNTTHCNRIVQNNLNEQIAMESLDSVTHLLPKDLMDEINSVEIVQPMNTGNNQYSAWDVQTQFTAEQPTTTPLNVYAPEFVLPYSEAGSMNTINLPQSVLQDDMIFWNEFFLQSNTYETQQILPDHNFGNEFYGLTNNINHPQATLQEEINFHNEFNGINNSINHPQATLQQEINFHNEFIGISNTVNHPQATLQQEISFHNEFNGINNTLNHPQATLQQEISFHNEFNGINNTLNHPQATLRQEINFHNEFNGINTINHPQATLQQEINCHNGFIGINNTVNRPQVTLQQEINFHNEFNAINSTVNHPQATLQQEINFLNEFDGINTVNHPQATLQQEINCHNGFAELNNTVNQSQPVLLDGMNLSYERHEGAIGQSQPIFVNGTNPLNECSGSSSMNNSFQPNLLDHINFFDEYPHPRYIGMSIPQPPLLDYAHQFNEFAGPSAVNLPEFTFINSNEFLNPNFNHSTNFSQPVGFDCMNFNNEGYRSTMNFQQPNGVVFNEFMTPYISNSLENNFSDYMNIVLEDYFLHGNTPRPILNRNYLDEYQIPDLLQNSIVHQTNFTEDYTTEYSLTHAIARPTGNDINNNKCSTAHIHDPLMEQLHYPLRHIDSLTECTCTPSTPRPILSRNYLDEFPLYSLNEFPTPYTSENHIVNHENASLNLCTESGYSLSVPRPILNRSGINGFPMPYTSQYSGLDQINPVSNYTNLYAEFLTSDTPGCNDNPKSNSASTSDQINFLINYDLEFPPLQKASTPNLNLDDDFPMSNIPEDSTMASTMVQMDVEPTHTNSQESPVSELSELSPHDE